MQTGWLCHCADPLCNTFVSYNASTMSLCRLTMQTVWLGNCADSLCRLCDCVSVQTHYADSVQTVYLCRLIQARGVGERMRRLLGRGRPSARTPVTLKSCIACLWPRYALCVLNSYSINSSVLALKLFKYKCDVKNKTHTHTHTHTYTHTHTSE